MCHPLMHNAFTIGGDSGLMREGLQHGFRTDRQVTDASARGGKDRVADRGRDCGRRRLTEANRRFCAREKFDLDLGYVAHAQQAYRYRGWYPSAYH